MPHTLSYCALIGKCALIRSNTVLYTCKDNDPHSLCIGVTGNIFCILHGVKCILHGVKCILHGVECHVSENYFCFKRKKYSSHLVVYKNWKTGKMMISVLVSLYKMHKP